jgi:hypothetical protein
MDKKQAIGFAGSGAELARILGVTRQAVSLWGDKLPELQVYRLKEKRPRWFRKIKATRK